MKLFSLALDYDGTIARDDRLDPAVRDSTALIRTRGVTVLLATGRILDMASRSSLVRLFTWCTSVSCPA